MLEGGWGGGGGRGGGGDLQLLIGDYPWVGLNKNKYSPERR